VTTTGPWEREDIDGTREHKRDPELRGMRPGVLIGAGGWRLRAEVPEAGFTLTVEADEVTAEAEHAELIGRCVPPAARGQVREAMLAQLRAARQVLADSGIGYLGVLAADVDGRPRMLVLGVAAATWEPPEGIDAASLLTAMLRHSYPQASALVEEFQTDYGPAVGVRRCDELTLPFPGPDGKPTKIDTGISQAIVIFPRTRLLGIVTGFCFHPTDIDLTTVFTATVAHKMTAVPYGGTLA
jgi:hypothetical protein